MTWALVVGIGLGAGILSGLFGIGGGIVIIPALVLLAKLDQHTANGTSLAALLLPVGLLATIEYYRRGQVRVPYAAILAAGLLLGGLIGARFAGKIPDVTLRRSFGVLLLVTAVRLLL